MVKYYDQKNTPKKFHYFYMIYLFIVYIINLVIFASVGLAAFWGNYKRSSDYTAFYFMVAIIWHWTLLIAFWGMRKWKKYGLVFQIIQFFLNTFLFYMDRDYYGNYNSDINKYVLIFGIFVKIAIEIAIMIYYIHRLPLFGFQETDSIMKIFLSSPSNNLQNQIRYNSYDNLNNMGNIGREDVKFCAMCGTKNSVSASFCKNCGMRI